MLVSSNRASRGVLLNVCQVFDACSSCSHIQDCSCQICSQLEEFKPVQLGDCLCVKFAFLDLDILVKYLLGVGC